MKQNHCDMSGGKNTNAKIIDVFNDKEELIFTSHGTFYKDCKSRNLPTNSLVRSYKNGGCKIGVTNYSFGNLKKRGHEIYKGWCAIVRL